MRIVFRVDASIEIGTGHVMRCLTLANALRTAGAECAFVCRLHQGNLLDVIAAQGHTAIALPAFDGGAARSYGSGAGSLHGHWLGTGWEEDANDTVRALHCHGWSADNDWLIVDHYALDARWQRALRKIAGRLMVIDDLADREHDCDMLLDQSLGRESDDYAGLVPAHATMLLGPKFALLRPEFAALREESLARRASPKLRNILVSMGGVDKDDATGQVLHALSQSELSDGIIITVVMGLHSPWLKQVRERAAQMRQQTCVLTGVSDMARLMTDSDLAIGGGGTTTWERCALGLPTITVILAPNQRGVAEEMKRMDATILIMRGIDLSTRLSAVLSQLNSEKLKQMSSTSRTVCDGAGAMRVLAVLKSAG